MTPKRMRVQFYGVNDSRSYDADELRLMRKYAKHYHKSQVKKLKQSSVSGSDYKAKYDKCIAVIKRFDAGIIGMYDL